jgi:hypothetical protein
LLSYVLAFIPHQLCQEVADKKQDGIMPLKEMKEMAVHTKSLHELYNKNVLAPGVMFGLLDARKYQAGYTEIFTDACEVWATKIIKDAGDSADAIKKYKVVIEACSSATFPPTDLDWALKDWLSPFFF